MLAALLLVAAAAGWAPAAAAAGPAAQGPDVAPQVVDPAFEAAKALKSKAAYRQAAEAFEAFVEGRPESPLRGEALVEAGVCRFSAGRSALKLYRVTPEARVEFDLALARFDRVVAEWPQTGFASRAAYMRGSTHFFAGDLEPAEAAYGVAFERYGVADRDYAAKALERRAFVRRHRLDPAGAIADYERWLKEFPGDAEAHKVRAHVELARTLGKPAPLITAEAWPHGDPAPLEALGGEVIAVYFFATWCPNCAKELPFVLDLAKRRGGEARFVGVIDRSKGQTPESIARYAAENALPFPIAMHDAASARAWNVATVPHLALIDRDGVLRWRDAPSNLAEATLDALLTEGLEPEPAKGK